MDKYYALLFFYYDDFILIKTRCYAPAAQAFSPHAMSLIEYVTAISIPSKIERLADVGYKNYQKNPLKSQLASVEWDAIGGGRTVDWIESTFARPENKIINELSKISAPQTWTIEEINLAYEKMTSMKPIKPSKKQPLFYLVEGVDASR